MIEYKRFYVHSVNSFIGRKKVFKKNAKRIFSVILAFALVLSLFVGFDSIAQAKEETNLDIAPESLELIDVLSGESRKNSYPNGDVVYNNTLSVNQPTAILHSGN